jgi:tetratricopeptide (TPR) repeat protein
MTMHQEWTDQLSDYLDDELQEHERTAVEAHLKGCAACTAVLNDLQRVVARAQAAATAARPPQSDLWDGVAGRIDRIRQPRRVSFTVTQLAAAAVILISVSAGMSWRLHTSIAGRGDGLRYDGTSATNRADGAAADSSSGSNTDRAADDVRVIGVSLADDQYDAAVADLEKALKLGRGKLDTATIAIVEQNIQTIDQAIAQAREALAADPANSYLTGHLVEARRRKLDLLRRATALTDMN